MNAQRIPWKVDFTGDPGKTKQSHKDECDINILVAKWRAGGQLPMPTAEQLYGDFASSPSFLEAKIQIADGGKRIRATPGTHPRPLQQPTGRPHGLRTKPGKSRRGSQARPGPINATVRTYGARVKCSC